jgi:hypothetical protein
MWQEGFFPVKMVPVEKYCFAQWAMKICLVEKMDNK